MQLFLAMADPLEDVLPHTYFSLGPFHVTNVIILSSVAALLMLLIFPQLFSKPDSGVPTGSKNLFESILEYLRLEVFRPALKENTDKFTPFLWTLFFFILFCNLLGCIPLGPVIELITLGHITNLGGPPTGNINTTAALAICAFIFIHANGIDQVARSLMDGTYGKHDHHDEHSANGTTGHEAAIDLEHMRGEALGADVSGDLRAMGNPTAHYDDSHHPTHDFHASALSEVSRHEGMTPLKALLLAIPLYLWNFAPHPFRPKEGEPKSMWYADIPMFSILLILELVGAVVKPFALCLRLFGNLVAGHLLLAVLIGLITMVPGIFQFLVGAPISVLDIGIQMLELFVAFLQAYIFTFLVTLFLASAVAPEH